LLTFFSTPYEDDRGQHATAAGEDADREAEHRAAQDRAARALPVLTGEGEPTDLADLAPALAALLERVEDLADTEETHGHRDEVDARVEVGQVEGEAGVAGDGVGADDCEEEADGGRDDALERRLRAEVGDHDDAEHRQGDVLRRAEADGEARQRRSDEDQAEDRDGATDEGPDGGDRQGRTTAALLGHLVAVDGRDGAGCLPRDAEEDRGDRAAVHRAVVDAGQHDDRRGGLHAVREGQEQRDGRRRPETGQHADDRPDEHADEDVQEVLRGRDDPEPVEEVVDVVHGQRSPHS
jgi:hypothetical protein